MLQWRENDPQWQIGEGLVAHPSRFAASWRRCEFAHNAELCDGPDRLCKHSSWLKSCRARQITDLWGINNRLWVTDSPRGSATGIEEVLIGKRFKKLCARAYANNCATPTGEPWSYTNTRSKSCSPKIRLTAILGDCGNDYSRFNRSLLDDYRAQSKSA